MGEFITTKSRRVREIMQRKQGMRMPANVFFNGGRFGDLPEGNARYVTEVLQDKQWSGSHCFIVGGGPSIKDFGFSRLKGHKVIAINRAYEFIPFADIMFSMDSRYYQWIYSGRISDEARQKYLDFVGIKLWLSTDGFPYRDCYIVKCPASYEGGRTGLSGSLADGLFHGNNSGCAAIQLAIVLDADPILLLGFDMKHEPDRTHFHNGYPSKQTPQMVNSFIWDFENIARLVKPTGRRIINLNRDSALRCFEFGNVNEWLK